MSLMQTRPATTKLAWLAYLVLAAACVVSALSALMGFAGVGFLIHDAQTLATALGLVAFIGGGVVSTAVLAFRRRIYWAWTALTVTWVPFLITAGVSALRSTS